MNIRNISLIIYRTAGEIRKHVLKPRPFVILQVYGNIDKVKHFVRLLDSGHLHLAPVLYITIRVMKQKLFDERGGYFEFTL